MLYLLKPIERHARRHLDSERNRRRFDRAKRFVDESMKREAGGEVARRIHARWLGFLCKRPAVQRDIWPEDSAFLGRFAADFGLPPASVREFVGLSLLGRLWRSWCHDELAQGAHALLAQLTRVQGWEHFERCARDGLGLILLPLHGQFARLLQPYLRFRGYEGVELGVTGDQLLARGIRSQAAKGFELAKQMHAAKHRLSRGGIVFNLPDARQNLDNALRADFFGRWRAIATGFAELALRTGAHAVPCAYRFSSRGFFVLEFGEPFQVRGDPNTHEERIESLVGQYADFLREEWRRYPWNIDWAHLRYFVSLPVAESLSAAPSPPAQALRPQ